MNSIELNLIWCILQVTVVCVLGLALRLSYRRLRGNPTTMIVQSALCVVLCLTAISVSPWPRWNLSSRSEVTVVPITVIASEMLSDPNSATRSSIQLQTDLADVQPSLWRNLVTSGIDLLRQTSRLSTKFVLPMLVVSIAIGAGRFFMGLLAIRQTVSHSRPITECSINTRLLELQSTMGCDRNVQLLESDQVTSPATVGWRKPAILLPIEWRNWSADETRAVLAHEIAHVARHDFGILIVAQLSTIFHFYQPLVHRLIAALRLEQELAADAAASLAVGGNETYLSVLATMALRRDASGCDSIRTPWPVRPFLSAPETITRRIEMLTSTIPSSGKRSFPIRIAAAATILIAGVFTAGFRSHAVMAQGDKPAAAKATDEATIIRARFTNAKILGLAMHNYHAKHKRFPLSSIKADNGVSHSWRVALLPFIDQQALYDQYRKNEPWDSPHNKQLLTKIPEVYLASSATKTSANSCYFVLVGDGTPFGGDQGARLRDFIDGLSSTMLIVESKRNIPWTKPEDIDYSSDKDPPKLGGWHEGGFVITLGDGAAQFIRSDADSQQLHNLIRMNDRNLLEREKIMFKVRNTTVEGETGIREIIEEKFDKRSWAELTAAERVEFGSLSKRAYEKIPDDPSAANLYADYLIASGDFVKALPVLRDLFETNPLRGLQAAAVARRLKRFDEADAIAVRALDAMKKMSDEDPTNLSVSLAVAQNQLFLKRFDESIETLDNAIKLAKTPQERQLSRQAFGDAIVALIKHVEDNSAGTIAERVQILKYLQDALERAPKNPRVLKVLSEQLVATLQQDDAQIDALRAALLEEAPAGIAHFIRGTAAMMNNDNEVGMRELYLAKEHMPLSSTVLNNLAFVMLQSGKVEPDQVLKIINEAIKLANKPPPHYYETRGQVLMRLKRYKEAIPDLERALKLESLMAKAHKDLASCYQQVGDKELAKLHTQAAEALEAE